MQQQTFFIPKHFKLRRPKVFAMKISPMLKELVRDRSTELGISMADYLHGLIVTDLQWLGRIPASELTDGVGEKTKKDQ